MLQHLAHELRQPLSALESIAYYLRLTAGESSPMSHQVSRVQSLVDHANWVLSDMLNIFHIAPPSPGAVDCEELLREVLEERWVTEGLTVRMEASEPLPVFADCEQLRHLLRTTIYFLRPAGKQAREIAVTMTEEAEALAIGMRVNAPEIPMESLYTPLASKSLLACQNIAELNGGQFRVARDIDGWLTVRIELPFAELQRPD
ncbi:MAG: HAMP domain-containing histidine kinase [Acidobacteria bacterium]|nr:HAMP domain-containing histidine kinase [Acidobacteriota bacterium]